MGNWNPLADATYQELVKKFGGGSPQAHTYIVNKAHFDIGEMSQTDYDNYLAVTKGNLAQWQPVMDSTGTRIIGYEYDPTGGEFGVMFNKYAAGEITEGDWLAYVNRAKQVATQLEPAPPAPSVSAIAEEAEKLQEETALQKLSTGEVVSKQAYELLPQPMQKELYKAGVEPYNEAIQTAVTLQERIPIDIGEYNKILSNQASPTAGHLVHIFTGQRATEEGIGMTVQEIEAKYRPVTGIPLSEYLQRKLALVNEGKTELQIANALADVYPYLNATDYGRQDPETMEKYGVVIKAGTWEKMTPWKEESGYTPTASDLFTMGVGFVIPGVSTVQNRNNMSSTELGVSIAVDVLMIAPFVGGIAKGAKTLGEGTLNILRNTFGDEGARIMASYSNRMAAAVEAGSAMELSNTADDFIRFATRAKGSGVQGMDELINRATIIKNSPEVFIRGTDKIPANLNEVFSNAYGRVTSANIIETGKPLGADALRINVVEERGLARTVTVPISRGEAERFGLNTTDIDRIYSISGQNREMFVAQANLTRTERMNSLFSEIDQQLAYGERVGELTGRGRAVVSTPRYRRMYAGQTEESAEQALQLSRARAAESIGWKEQQALVSARVEALPETERTVQGIFRSTGNLGKELETPVAAALKATPRLNPAEWQIFRLGDLTLDGYKAIVAGLAILTATQQLQYLVVANLFEYGLANDTEATLRILSQANDATKVSAISTVPQELQSILTGAANQVVAEPSTVTQIQAIAETEVQPATAISTQPAVQPQTEVQVQPEVEPQAQPQVQPQVKQEVGIQTIIPTPVEEGIKPPRDIYDMGTTTGKKKPPYIPIPPDSEITALTPVQRMGAVAWKQGWCYKLIYPPYGQANILNSKKPFPGMKIHATARGALHSIIALGGQLPPTITRDMGIMDVSISTSRGENSKPSIKYRLDRNQQTNLTPKIVRGK